MTTFTTCQDGVSVFILVLPIILIQNVVLSATSQDVLYVIGTNVVYLKIWFIWQFGVGRGNHHYFVIIQPSFLKLNMQQY